MAAIRALEAARLHLHAPRMISVATV